MLPSIDSRDDAIGVCCPDEGFRIFVGLGNKAVDGGLQVIDRAKHTALQSPAGELCKEAFDGIQP